MTQNGLISATGSNYSRGLSVARDCGTVTPNLSTVPIFYIRRWICGVLSRSRVLRRIRKQIKEVTIR